MPRLFFAIAIAITTLIFGSCSHHHHGHAKAKHIPPGQAKKITGSKSAKPYAPGQQKQHHRKH